MKEKILSIIIPVYNDQRVKCAIDSVLNYKDESLELIVIDGGSLNETKEVLQRMRDDLDYFVSEKDKNVNDAINKGIIIATGKWVLVLASDDILACNPLKIIEKYDDGNEDIICGNLIAKNENGYTYGVSKSDLSALDYRCSIKHPASFFKRTLYFKYGFYDDTLYCAADREIFLRFRSKDVKFQFIPEYIVIFTNSGGLSTKNPLKYAYKEDKQISLKYGMNKFVVTKDYILRCLSLVCRRARDKVFKLFGIKRKKRFISHEEITRVLNEQNDGLK